MDPRQKSFPSHIKNWKQPIGAIFKPPKLEFPSLLFSIPPLKNTAKPISSYSQKSQNEKIKSIAQREELRKKQISHELEEEVEEEEMARKRVEAESTDGSVDANTTTSLVRAKDGSAFAKWYFLAFPFPPTFFYVNNPEFFLSKDM